MSIDQRTRSPDLATSWGCKIFIAIKNYYLFVSSSRLYISFSLVSSYANKQQLVRSSPEIRQSPRREHQLHVTTSSLSEKRWPMSVQKKWHTFASLGRSRRAKSNCRDETQSVTAMREPLYRSPGARIVSRDCILYRRRVVQPATSILLSAGSVASAGGRPYGG